MNLDIPFNRINAYLFIQNNMPYFTLPFCLPTMVFINVNDTRGFLHRVEYYSYPEKQTRDWYKSKRVSEINLLSCYNKTKETLVHERKQLAVLPPFFEYS